MQLPDSNFALSSGQMRMRIDENFRYLHRNLQSTLINYHVQCQWRNYYELRPGEPGGPQPQWAKWGPPGLGDRAKTLARASDMLQCRFLTVRIL
jgi:hypothetical protein